MEKLRRATEAPGVQEHYAVTRERHMTPAARKKWAGQAAWDAAHLATVSTRMSREEYAEFRRLCRLRRTSPYRVVGTLVRLWMDGMAAAERDAAEEKGGDMA